MPDQKADKDYSDAELTKLFRESARRAPDYIRKHIDVNRIRAVNATGQNPADYASADQKDAVNHKDAIADVRNGSRTVVHIYRPSEFAKDPDQITGHEAIHLIQNGLPDGELDKFAPVNPKAPYNYGGNAGIAADAKAGKPISSLSAEQQAAMSQYKTAFDKFADEPTSTDGGGVPTAAQQDWENNRGYYKHYTDQIANWPQKPYSDDTEPIIKDDDPRLKIGMNLNPDLPTAGTIPAATPAPVSNVSTGSFQAGMLFGPDDSAPGEAPPQNIFNQGLAATPPSAAAPPASSGNIFDQGMSSSPEPTTSATPSLLPQTSSAPNLFNVGLGQQAPQNPLTGQPPNPNEGLLDRGKDTLKKAWNWANTPLVNFDDALGRTNQASGFEKGVNDLMSGLTSPLSIGLTLATFGAGGLLESGGASALRAAGLGAEEIGEVTKGAEIIANAVRNGKTTEDGIAAAQASGVDIQSLTKGLQVLRDARLDGDSLLNKGLARRVGSTVLRNLGVNVSRSEQVGKGLQALMGAGFTAQNAYQAISLSPKVLDAVKDGDYDLATRLAVDVVGTGAMAGLGAHEVAQESGGAMDDLRAKMGLSVKPTMENELLRKHFGVYKADEVEASQANNLWANDLRKSNPKMSSDQLRRIRYFVESGLDENRMAERFNSHAENADRPDRIPVTTQSPENGQEDVRPISTGLSPDRLQEAVNSHFIKQTYTPEEIDTLLDTYDPRKLSDEDKAVAATIRSKFSDTLTNAQKEDALGKGVEDYVTNMWKPGDEDNPSTNLLRNSAHQGNFSINTSQAQERTFDSAFEGEAFGKKLAETDPIALAAHNANTFARVIAARKMMAHLQDDGVRNSDGRPVLALSGMGQLSSGEKPAVFVNPDTMRSQRIPDNIVEGLKTSGGLDRMLREDKIVNLKQKIYPDNLQQNIDRLENIGTRQAARYDEAGNNVLRQQLQTLKDIRDGKLPITKLDEINAQRPDVFAWNPNDYEVIDHPALKDWNHVAQTQNGDDIVLKGDLRVHPESAEYMRKLLGREPAGPGEGTLGKGILRANREGKGLLLFGSPFHVAQEGLRAVMTGVNPFGIERWDLTNDPVLRQGVEQGLTLGKDHHALAAFKGGQVVGNSAIIAKIPGLSKIQSSLDHFLFDKYVPGLKVRAYRSLVERYREAYPDWTDEKVARVAASDTNERFGGINYQQLGRSAATQNWLKILALAPDWLEGELRAIGRPFGTEGKVARFDMVRAAVGLWGAARILNYLNSGKFHNEAPFGVATKDDKGDEKIYSIRTLPTDMLHAVSDPYGFVQGRVSPLVKAGTELVTGRDERGRRLPHSGIALDLLRSVAPIPTQATIKSMTGQIPDVNSGEQLARAGGLTVMPYKTEAEKMAAQIASDHSEAGPVDPALLHRHQLLIDFEDRVRAGQMSLPQVWQMVVSGDLAQTDAQKISENVKLTRKMTPDTAKLYTRASRAPAPDFMKIWDIATPTEQKALEPLMKQVRKRYITKAMKDETPAERLRDPLLHRFMTAMPEVSPF